MSEPSLELEGIRAQIAQLLGPGVGLLVFPEPFEALFETEFSSRRAGRMWREALSALLSISLFYVIDFAVTHQVTRRELLVELLLVLPLGLATCEVLRRRPPMWLREGVLAVAGCVITGAYLATQLGKGPVAIAFSLIGVIVIELVLVVMLRLRFRFALPTTIAIGAMTVVYLRIDTAMTAEQAITGAALTMVVMAVAMMSNFGLEREERVSYLRALESEVQRREVAEMNTRLAEISTRDKLTGLPNRRAYEEQFELMWNDAAAEGAPLSAIVLDIDHFKSLNDVCGHVYGDEVLRRVGALLPQALRSTADFVARYGGEEFVVLLPRTERDSAELVAERVRALIEMAGSPPQPALPQEECLMWVTVSCGASTCYPIAGLKPEELIEQADHALYKAKASGRNCVCFESSYDFASQRQSPRRENVA